LGNHKIYIEKYSLFFQCEKHPLFILKINFTKGAQESDDKTIYSLKSKGGRERGVEKIKIYKIFGCERN
jgi:hypothetical protein